MGVGEEEEGAGRGTEVQRGRHVGLTKRVMMDSVG
jgi:hypothetical protein